LYPGAKPRACGQVRASDRAQQKYAAAIFPPKDETERPINAASRGTYRSAEACFPGQIASGCPLPHSLLILLIFFALAFEARAEAGLASYYSYGNRGERGEMTCAHRTRSFGSIVTVTYSGRSIQCRVADRGPFIRGRIIDLSVKAARALGMMEAGVVRVSVE
jgi:rare lipoprotein A